MAGIVTSKSFEPSSLVCLGLKVNPSSRGKSVPLRYAGSDFVVRTPKMYLPVIWDNAENPEKFTLELSFRGMEERPDLKAFHDTVRAIESRVLDIALEHAVEWFKAKPNVTRDAIEMLFSSMLREPADFPASMRVTAYTRNGRLTFKTYDAEKNPIAPSSVNELKGSDVIAGIECAGVWISGSKFGLTWKLAQVRVFPRERAAGGSGVGGGRRELVARPPRDIDISDVTFSAPKMTNNGGRIVYVNLGDGSFVVRTPMLYAPFGMGVWTDDAGTKYSLDLSLKDFDSDPETKEFYDLITGLETKAKSESAAANWFRNGVPSTFGSVIKQKNPNHPPTIKINVVGRDNSPCLELADVSGEPLEMSDENIGIFTGAKVSVEAMCTGVWMHGGRFGLSFRAVRATLVPNTRSIDMLMDDDDEEPSDVGATSAAPQETASDLPDL